VLKATDRRPNKRSRPGLREGTVVTDTAIDTRANAKATPPERRSELVAMGVAVVVGLIFFHSAQTFYGGHAFVQNEPR
jgi:hypothetical protein